MPTWDEFAWAAFLYGRLGGDVKYQTLMQNPQVLPLLRTTPMAVSDKMVQDHILKGFLNAWKTRIKNSPQTAQAIKTSIHNMLPDLTALSPLTIVTIQFTQQDISHVENCYHNLRASGHKIGPTATAKILHILRPALFVMWDGPILEHFGIQLGITDSPQGYVAYLQMMSGVANAIRLAFSGAHLTPPALPGQTAEDYLSAHLRYIPQKTMAKFLDEYYWVTITNGVSVPPRWHP